MKHKLPTSRPYVVCMTASTRKAIGMRIRALRKENRLSQEKFALMVSVERSYLARVEMGQKNPSIDVLEKIAHGLGMTLSELFEGVDSVEDELRA